ncbi:MAG: Crp/Fnr family transcriptional regulator [Gammaproteobacteria bacterium]|nr:Crp/Fnr family transcriptional regulator [Gammaproteobacteria bacterium]
MTRTADRLKSIPLFADLNDSDRELLAGTQVARKFQKNVIVLHEGDQSNALYIVESGQVKVSKINEEGKEVVLCILGEGDHFGEMSLIDDEPRSASIITKTVCEFSVIRKQEFEQVLNANPELALAMMRSLCQRLRAADRSIESLALMDVYGRIARLLLDSAIEQDGKQVVPGKLTHKDIAQMVGSSREMVSRIFKDLSDGGYISKLPDGIAINTTLPARW